MRDYQKGKIYKIASYKTSLVYIGSTVQKLPSRMSGHRKKHRSYQTGNKDYTSSFEILAYGDAKIVLVESFPCSSKYELEKRERYWIEQTECVNKNVPTRTRKEHYETNKEHLLARKKQYYQDNKEKGSLQHNSLRQQQRQYYQDNKDAIKRADRFRHSEFGKMCKMVSNGAVGV